MADLNDKFKKALEYKNAKNYTMAFDLMRNSATEGHPESQVELGYMYENSQGVVLDYVEAARWYYLALINGYKKAKVHLGSLLYCYRKGLTLNLINFRSYRLCFWSGNILLCPFSLFFNSYCL
jgi:TPR repeat protein